MSTNTAKTFNNLGYSCNTANNKIGMVINNNKEYQYASYDKINTIGCEFLSSLPTKTLNNILCTSNTQSSICQSAFDNYHLYPSKNPLVVMGNDVNYNLKNAISDQTQLYNIGTANSSIFTNLLKIPSYNYDASNAIQMQTVFNTILQEAPLKAGCCLRNQNDTTSQIVNMYTQNMPSIPTTSPTTSPTTIPPTNRTSSTTIPPTNRTSSTTTPPTNRTSSPTTTPSTNITSSPTNSTSPLTITPTPVPDNIDFSLSSITIPPNTCPVDLYNGSAKCNGFYDVYCQNVVNYFNDNNLTYDQLTKYAPQCSCYFTNTPEQSIFPRGTPSKCYKPNCSVSKKNYMDSSSRNKVCSLNVCNTILNANQITSLGSKNINNTILENCGYYIPTEQQAAAAAAASASYMNATTTNSKTNPANSPMIASSQIIETQGTSNNNNTLIIITIVGIILIAIYFFIM